MGNGNQTPLVERHQTRADQVVATARRHAEEIRAIAEEEAERVLLEAEREAARRHEERSRQAEELRITAEQEAQRVLLEAQREAARRRDERLEADRRERASLAISKRQIEESLDATAAAVTRIRELIAAFPSVESQQPLEIADASDVPAATVPPEENLASRRNRVMNFVAVVFGVWAVVMVATLAVLPRQPIKADTTAPVLTSATGTTTADIAHARAEGVVVPPRALPAATRTTASEVDIAATRSSNDEALIVAFVAARDCWISIATDDGTWNERLLRASEHYVARARDVVSFKAGNAGALSVLINDRPAGSLGAEGQVVARRITRANYRSFLQS
jgi:hypothetical protein